MYPKIRYISDYAKKYDRCIYTIEELFNLTDETALEINYIKIDMPCPSKYNYLDILNKILLCEKLKIYIFNCEYDFKKYTSLFPSLLYVDDYYDDHDRNSCYVLQNNILTITTNKLCPYNKCLYCDKCSKCFVKYKMNTLYYKYVNLQIYGRHVYIINALNQNVEYLTFTKHTHNLGYNYSFSLKKIRIVLYHNAQKKYIKIPFGTKCSLYTFKNKN